MTTGPWEGDAACTPHDADLFYPEHDGANHIEVRIAKAICRSCPVAEPCLFAALDTDPANDHGIRGATTKRERAAIRRQLEARRAA